VPPGVPLRSDDTLPRRSGGFELQDELGRGGMGVVYRAQELTSGRVVALKVLLAEHALSPEAFERFQREARIAASISDSRCVFVYGAHQIDGAPAISMELVGGETIEHKIARGETIPIETAVRWTLEILDGLEAAHMAGVVHRDVKPSNCFVNDEGQVKVGDFGLARTFETDLRLTLTGQFLGSPLYASPEQIKGRDIDLRSDLYSCGATLYAMLTGNAPHSGSNLGEVLSRILTESAPPPRSIRSEIPRSLERVVLQAMERDPKKRFQTHAEMRSALLPFVSSSTTPAHPLRRALAFGIDLGVLLAARWMLDFSEVWVRASFPASEGPVAAGLPWVQLALPLAYFGVFETLYGAALGKGVLGLRVVSDQRTRQAWWSLARTGLYWSPRIALGCVAMLAVEHPVLQWLLHQPVAWLLMTLWFVTARPTNGWQGLHDRLTRTRVIQRRALFASAARSRPPAPSPLKRYPDMPERIGRYAVEGEVGRGPYGILLEARDAELQRSVWILALADSLERVAEARRVSTRGGRIRWLDALEGDGTRYEVFEAPGGASLIACSERGLEFGWARMQRLLASLIDELQAAGAPACALEQLWVDGSWNLRIIDAPPGREPGPPLAAERLLVEAARRMMPNGAVLPPDLPEHAEAIAQRLLGTGRPFANLAEAGRALASLRERSTNVPVRARATQLVLSLLPAALFGFLLLIASIYFAPRFAEAELATRLAEELAAGSVTLPAGADGSAAGVRPLNEEEIEARYILLSEAQHRSEGTSWAAEISLAARSHKGLATQKHPSPSEAELAWAREHFGPGDPERAATLPFMAQHSAALPLAMAFFWGLAACASALVFRGGVTLRALELRLRNRRGQPASRLRCVWRSFATWMALLFCYAAALAIGIFAGAWAGGLACLAVLALHVVAIGYAITNPARSLQDRVAGTRIVPV